MSPPRRKRAEPKPGKCRLATLELIQNGAKDGLPPEGTPLFAKDGRPAGFFTRGVLVECGCQWRRWDREREQLYDEPVRQWVAPSYVGRRHDDCRRPFKKVKDA